MANSTKAKFQEIRDTFLHDVIRAESLIAADRSLLDVRSGIGETVLHWLAIENILDGVRSLISLGADPDTKNEFGQTPLMEAASLGYEDMCLLLLRHGADVRYVSEGGESPLCHAARSRQVQTLRILLERFPADENLQRYFDETDLEMIYMTDDEVSEILKSRGLTTPKEEWT